jgi:hypothetical protein
MKQNKVKVRRIGRKRKALPPHTWESHPTANHGEVNKTLIIAVVAIFAIVALAALLFFSDQFVGQAIFLDEDVADTNQVGIFPNDPVFELEESSFIPIVANFEEEITSFTINLSYDSSIFNVDCDSGMFFDDLDLIFNDSVDLIWEKNVNCGDGLINFHYAVFPAIDGSIKLIDETVLGRIDFTAIGAGESSVEVVSSEFINLDGNPITMTWVLPTLTVLTPELCENGVLDLNENCDGDQFLNSCESHGFNGGTPTCTPGCYASYSSCELSQEGETCSELLGLSNLFNGDSCDADLVCEEGVCVTEEPEVCMGAVAYWNFDEEDATDSINNYYSTISGATWSSSKGYDDSGAYGFNAYPEGCLNDCTNSDLIITPEISFEDSTASICFWTNPDALNVKEMILHGDVGNGTFEVYQKNDVVTLRGGTGSPDVNTGSVLTPGVWTHICAVVIEDLGKIYINGQFSVKGTIGVPKTHSKPLFIGAYSDGSYGFDGIIDHVAVFDNLLTGDEVSEIYHNTLNGKDSCGDDIEIQDNFVCVDSDSGQLSFVKGNVSNIYFDSCATDQYVREWYCDENVAMNVSLKCPDETTCQDGACVIPIAPEMICEDSDGDDISTFGTVVATLGDLSDSAEDSCVLKAVDEDLTDDEEPTNEYVDSCSGDLCAVNERTCGEESIENELVDCPTGCTNGVCVLPGVEEPVVEPIIVLTITPEGKVTATLTAATALTEHLFFVRVVGNNSNDVVDHKETKAALAVGETETITFDLDPELTEGTYIVKAFAWTNWLSLDGIQIENAYVEAEYVQS